jgi:hypothetical protein
MSTRAEDRTSGLSTGKIDGSCASFLEAISIYDRAVTFVAMDYSMPLAPLQSTIDYLQHAVPGRFTTIDKSGESNQIPTGFFAIRYDGSSEHNDSSQDMYTSFVGPTDVTKHFAEFAHIPISADQSKLSDEELVTLVQPRQRRVGQGPPTDVTITSRDTHSDQSKTMGTLIEQELRTMYGECMVSAQQDRTFQVQQSIGSICRMTLATLPHTAPVDYRRFLHRGLEDPGRITAYLLWGLDSRLSELTAYELEKDRLQSLHPHFDYEAWTFLKRTADTSRPFTRRNTVEKGMIQMGCQVVDTDEGTPNITFAVGFGDSRESLGIKSDPTIGFGFKRKVHDTQRDKFSETALAGSLKQLIDDTLQQRPFTLDLKAVRSLESARDNSMFVAQDLIRGLWNHYGSSSKHNPLEGIERG